MNVTVGEASGIPVAKERTPLIVLVGADKGGVGKTTVCRALCDYMDVRLIHAPAPRVLDSQFPAGDLARFRSTAEVINITDIRDQMRVFDTLTGVTIVDIAAGLLTYTMGAFEEARLLDDVRAGNLQVALLHVLGPTVTSLSEIAEATRVLGTDARHFIVKNHVNETNFFEWDTDSGYARSLRALAGVTVDVPNLKAVATEAVQESGSSFQAFTEGRANRVLRGYVRSWLDRVWSEFDRVGLGAVLEGTG